MTAHGLRDVLKAVSPPWKRTGIFEKLDFAMGVVLDAIVDKVDQAIAARVPTRTRTITSLPLIGADRLIPQGFSEAAGSYGVRLQHAYDSWSVAGTARAVISQVLGYVSPLLPRVRGVTNTSAWDSVAAGLGPDSVPVHVLASPANWDWDSLTTARAAWNWRTWLIIYPGTTGLMTTGPAWGDGHRWGDGSTWGTSWTADQGNALRAIIKLWKAARSSVTWVIFSFDDALFDPAVALPSVLMPDGSWGPWHKVVTLGDGRVVCAPSRSASARYMSGCT